MSRSLKRQRVFIGMTEVAGYYSNLERGLRSLGVDARFFDLSPNPLRFSSRGILGTLKRPATRASNLRSADPRSLRGIAFRIAAAGYRLVAGVVRIGLFGVAVARYDVFIFHGLDSFLGYRDLPILKKLGKRVIYVFTGSDHRPPYLNGKWVRRSGSHDLSWLAEESRRFADRVAIIERYADCIVAHSASAQFHERPFVQFLAIGIPFEPPEGDNLDDVVADTSSDRIRILHCPTDPVSKGSDTIRSVIEALRSEGHEIEYVEIAGRPNAEVLDAIRTCDLVVDQLWSDTPMAGLATEAAFFGKPTVVSGYFARDARADLGDGLMPPTSFCPPDGLQDGIRRLIEDRDLRLDLGRRAQAFVTERWTPQAVAARFLRLIDDDVPAEWLYDPMRLRYVLGFGLPEEMVRNAVRTVLQTTGPEGLKVAHNRELEARLLALAD